MGMMPRITAEWLRRRRASCTEQIQCFTRLYPDGAEVTAETVRQAQAAGLDTLWALCHLMTPVQKREFILFTLRLRQPYLVQLFARAGFPRHNQVKESIQYWAATQALDTLHPDWNINKAAAWEVACDAARDTIMADARGVVWRKAWLATRSVAKAVAWDVHGDIPGDTRAAMAEEALRLLGVLGQGE